MATRAVELPTVETPTPSADSQKRARAKRKLPVCTKCGEPRRRGYCGCDVERLVDGWISAPQAGEARWQGGMLAGDDGSWLLHRARLERFGEVDSEECSEVLDIERAVTALQKSHPVAAMTLALVMFGWDPAELERDLGRFHRPATTHLDRGIAYCRAYLSGDDPERAFLAAKPRDIPSSR